MKQSSGSFAVLMVAVILSANSYPAFAAEKAIKITIPSHVTPKYQDIFPEVQRFADRLNELGKGKIEAKLFHSESLVKVKDIVPSLMKGTCEIIFHTSSHTTDIWPEIGGLGLPFLYKDETDCRNRWMSGKPLFELVNKEMDRKYGVRILAAGILKGLLITTRQKAIEKPEDLKGLTIRSIGKTDAEYFKACGAKPIFLSSSEILPALKHGSLGLDGLLTYPETIVARNLDEVLDYIVDSKPMFGAWGYQMYVLNKTFESWPEEVREIVLQAAGEFDQRYLENSLEYYHKNVQPRLEKKIKFVSPSPENMKKFIEIAQGTYKYWSESVDKEFAKKFIELSQTP